MRVLVVGAGFAGRLHAEAWEKLGYKYEFYDPYVEDPNRISEMLEDKDIVDLLEDKDIVDFCDTPLSRLSYLCDLYGELKDKEIYVEKPPCRPML